jgi:hypothetical protein
MKQVSWPELADTWLIVLFREKSLFQCSVLRVLNPTEMVTDPKFPEEECNEFLRNVGNF